MRKPWVTVLMPVYNAEKFLKEAIDSILNQTFPNFEFLIIDDGSTDSSAAIIHSYKDERIRFIKNETNLGITATLNKGIDLAKTELIARMDADDISYPERLHKQYNHFQQYPDIALLSTWAREVNEKRVPVVTEKFKSEFFYYTLTFDCWIYHPTVMYKRSAVLDAGKYQASYTEDFDLWWRLSRKYKIYNYPEVLLDYRLTNESLSKVTHKAEYETGHNEQALRNIRFYTKDAIHISAIELACLRHNFTPIIQKNDLSSIVVFFKKLDFINNCILQTANVNCNSENIREAAEWKKKFILNRLTKLLSKHKAFILLIRMGHWKQLCQIVSNRLSKLLLINKLWYVMPLKKLRVKG